MKIYFTLNGRNVDIDAVPTDRLIDVLRDQLQLKGVKEGCGEGECGACTVLLDGDPVNACLMLAGQVHGKDLLTVEGLTTDGALHPVQAAFAETGAVQCGFCTPGFIMSTVALLQRIPTPTDEQIIHALAGHVCRCTGYRKILDAVRRATELLAQEVPLN